MSNKKFRLSLLPVLAAVLWCAAAIAADPPDQPVGFHCVITPSQTVELGSPVPGQLQEVLVDRSDRVERGQLVAQLETTVEEASLDIAKFRASIDTEVRRHKSALAIDRAIEHRMKSLAKTNVASAQERDRASREARQSKWRARVAEDELRLHGLEMTRAEAVLERRKIRSPIDGVVLARLHNSGEYIEDDPLMRIVKLDPLHVEAILPMRLFGQVEPGMRAEVMPELDGVGTHEAVVELVDPMGDAASGTFGVRLSLANPDRQIPAGLKCQVKLKTVLPVLSTTHEKDETTPRLAATDEPRR